MKCLVTGACGFIGSNLVDSLISKGWSVVGIDNQSSIAHDRFYFNPKATYLDKKDSDISTPIPWKVLANEKFDYVFHMAAECRIQYCIENPKLCIDTNILGTRNTLEYSSKNGVKRLMFSSTSAIYAKHDYAVDENAEPTCLNPYSSTKLAAEVFCQQYSMIEGLDTVILRYFNVYGERQPVRGTYAPVIGVFQKQLKDGTPFTIVGDGEQRRDFVHVSDIVDANILAAQSELGGGRLNGEVFNIGTGINYSVNQISKMVSETNSVVHLPARAGEARITLCDNEKAVRWLNWTPKVSVSDWLSVDKVAV